MYQKLYKSIFWFGYTATLLLAFLPIAGNLSKFHVGPPSFDIRLDHLLHFGAYLLICLYYLAGRKPGYRLFSEKPLFKFIVAVLLLATVTELVQLWVPVRAFNPFDLVANLTGVAVGMVGILVEDRRSKIEDLRSKIEDRRPKIEDRRSKIEDLRSKIEGRRLNTEDRRSKIGNPRLKLGS